MNMTSHILFAEIKRILEDKVLYLSMQEHAKVFFKKDAANKIAEELVSIALSHEK